MDTPHTLHIMFLGDIVGDPGCEAIKKWVPRLKEKYTLDVVIANCENASSNGKGISRKRVETLKESGIDILTSGNHIWNKKEIYAVLDERNDFIRPANYPSQCPGKGYCFWNVKGETIAVLNLQGNVFMDKHLDCPFKTALSLLTFLKSKANIIIVDFHAEATSEKQCLGIYLDGQVSAVLGTHTHVQTADERILPKGTAFITDAGHCGPLDSVIGNKFDSVSRLFLMQMPTRFEVEDKGAVVISGVFFKINTKNGKALEVKKLRIVDTDILSPK